MDEQALRELTEQGEGQELEFKDPRVKPRDIAESLVAFANSNAARIIIGINDRTRKPTGILDKEEAFDNIHRAASLQCCSPAINISVDKSKYDGCPVLVVTIPYQPTDVFATSSGKILIRRGTENVPASSYEIRTLYSSRGKLNYERQIIPEATMRDLDLDLVKAYRTRYREARGKEHSLDNAQLLENLGCITRKEDSFAPTVAGLLLFGRSPQRFLPQNYLTIVRYPGTEERPTLTTFYDLGGNGASLKNPGRRYRSGDAVELTFLAAGERFTLVAEVLRTSRNGEVLHVRFAPMRETTRDRIIGSLFQGTGQAGS